MGVAAAARVTVLVMACQPLAIASPKFDRVKV